MTLRRWTHEKDINTLDARNFLSILNGFKGLDLHADQRRIISILNLTRFDGQVV